VNESLQPLFTAVRRAPSLVFCLTVFVLLCIANYFLWKHYQAITAAHEEVRRNGEKMFSALSSHNRLVTELGTVDDAIKRIDQNLIAEGDLAENQGYFYQLETLSRVRLTQLTQLSSQPAGEGNPYKSVPFSLRTTGSFPQLISFLRELESGPRLLRIRTFDLGRGDARTKTVSLSLTVELLASP